MVLVENDAISPVSTWERFRLWTHTCQLPLSFPSPEVKFPDRVPPPMRRHGGSSGVKGRPCRAG